MVADRVEHYIQTEVSPFRRPYAAAGVTHCGLRGHCIRSAILRLGSGWRSTCLLLKLERELQKGFSRFCGFRIFAFYLRYGWLWLCKFLAPVPLLHATIRSTSKRL